MLDLPDDEVRLGGLIVLGGDDNQWHPFSKRFTVPSGTHTGRVWVRSMNAAVLEAYLDDIAVVPAEPEAPE